MSSQSSGATPRLEVDGEGIAWITFDDPDRKVNVLTENVMRRFSGVVQEVQEGAEVGRIRAAVIRSGKAGSFIAGADVEAIAGIEDPEEGHRASRLGQAIFVEVEELPVPTVAAIHGVCLGGGTELALACRYRVASDHGKTEIGLPEVQLGILPAWGGTTRLPRLVGLQSALEMILTGKRVSSGKARSIGLVDEVFPSELFQQKVQDFLQELLETGSRATGADRGFLQRLLEDTAPGRRLVLHQARKKVLERTDGHYPAPLRILKVLRSSLGSSVEKGLDEEARAAGELIVSPVSKNLIHLFLLREEARKGTGVESGVEPGPVRTLGVVGAGVMGGGIAQLAAYHDLQVRLKDVRHEAVADGLYHARKLFRKAARKGKLEEREVSRRMELISGGLTYDGFPQADLVVEAVVERLDVKRTVLSELEEVVGDECVLATNTSSLSVDEMASELEGPERFGGMHFFNPVHKMPLVEVVRGERTGDRAVATIYALALELGKVPVVVKDGPGFLVNRILGPYLNEAGHLLAEGARVQAVDEAAENFGMPMGPLRLLDEVGIDVARHAGDALHDALGDRLEPAPPLLALENTDRLGRKGGLGFYRYEDDDEAGVDEEIYAALGASVPHQRREVEEREIRARLFLMMLNEAILTLEDGIAGSAGDVDLAMIMGTGFPPFRGGPLRFADTIHPRNLLDRLEEYQESLGPRFRPAETLRDLAREDRRIYDAFP